MQVQPFRLFVFFVPSQVQPLQAIENGIHGRLGIAFNVSIVKAEDHGAAIVAGIEPVEDESAGAAHVEKTGGRGREADARLGRRGIKRNSGIGGQVLMVWG